MSKIFVDQIQKSGQTALSLPNTTSTNASQYLQVNAAGQLYWSNGPVVIQPDVLIQTGSSPMIFAIASDYTSNWVSSRTYTSELGQWYNSGAEIKLGIATGRYSGATNNSVYNNYKLFPSIQFITGSRGEFAYVQDEMNMYGGTSNMYTYPDKMLGMIFVKNTTGAPITRTFYCRVSAYWNSGYEGSNITLMVPDATNTQIAANPASITALTSTNISANSSTSANLDMNGSITIPADTTVCINCYSTPRFVTSSYDYQFQYQFRVYDFFTNFMTTGLEVDIARTVKAIQNPTNSNSVLSIWQ